MRKVLVALLACVGMTLLAAPAPADVVIDDFTTTTNFNPPPVVGTSLRMAGSPALVTPDVGTNIWGGTRTVTFGAVSGGPADFISGLIAGNFFNYSSTLGANSNLKLDYSNGVPSNWTGFSALEISIMGFDFGNGNPLPVAVTIGDGSSGTANASLNAAGNFNLVFPLASFVGADLTNIKNVSLDFAANEGHDFKVGPIVLKGGVIPEPMSMLVWTTVGLVGCAFGWRFRRRIA